MTPPTLENETMSQVEQIVGKLIPVYEAYQEGEKSLADYHGLHGGFGRLSKILHNDPGVEHLQGPATYQFYADVGYGNLFLLSRRHKFRRAWFPVLDQTYPVERERRYNPLYNCEHIEKFTAVRDRFLKPKIQEFSVYKYKSYELFSSIKYEIWTEARWNSLLPHNPLKIYARALENWRRFQQGSPTQLTRSAQEKVWEILKKNISEREVNVDNSTEWPPKLPSMEVYGR